MYEDDIIICNKCYAKLYRKKIKPEKSGNGTMDFFCYECGRMNRDRKDI